MEEGIKSLLVGCPKKIDNPLLFVLALSSFIRMSENSGKPGTPAGEHEEEIALLRRQTEELQREMAREMARQLKETKELGEQKRMLLAQQAELQRALDEQVVSMTAQRAAMNKYVAIFRLIP